MTKRRIPRIINCLSTILRPMLPVAGHGTIGTGLHPPPGHRPRNDDLCQGDQLCVTGGVQRARGASTAGWRCPCRCRRSWVPFWVEERGSSRHSVLPWDCSRISPLASSLHFSLEAPLQVHRMTLLRMPPLPWSFRHLPLWMNSLWLNCQFSAGSEPLQVQITTCARLDELLPRSSRHLLPKPTTCGGLLVVVGEGLGDGLADTADV